MNFNFLYLHHMMNQLNGAHLHPGLGHSGVSGVHHHSRFAEPLPPQHTRERLSEMQKCVSASLAQLKPYPVPVPDMARRYSDTETPQDLSLRYPIKHEHETSPSPDDAMVPPPPPPVKTEPDDPGYRIHDQRYPPPPPPPEHLARSYSLPARDSGDLSEARLVNTVRQRSLDRATGHTSRETKASGSREKEEVNSSRTIIEFDNNDHVLCRVCGDKASGFHYGVHSCEGCKGFFRRSIQQKINYRPCTKNQQCTIQRINRNRCQYCRLKKCMAAGMSRDAVRFGRVPKREKAKITAAMESSRLKNMENRVMAEMLDDAKIIETIVRAHFDTCDYTADKIKPFIAKAHQDKQFTQCTGLTCPMKGRPEQSFLDTFSERFMNHVRQVCTFAKSIPGFKCLHHDDQVCLLKSCIFEVLLVRLSGLFDNQRLVCLNGDVIKRETISAMPAGNAKFLLDSVFELAQRINRFRLADAEIGLFCSVVIIAADRPGLRNPEIVGQMQSKLKMVLQNILAPQHPDNSSIFSELLTILHDLRTLNTLHTEKFLQQARVTGDQVRDAARDSTCPGPRVPVTMLYGGAEHRDWEQDNQDRDSTGSRSPQSSDSHVTNHSYSYDEINRRSPIGSVSSSESLGSSETFSKLSVNDLKIHGVGSVLLNALTSPAMTANTCPINRKRGNETARVNVSETERPETTGVAGEQPAANKCPFKSRKLDSPSDSGIDSPKAQGSQSTNTSVCSSPRSSMEDNVKEIVETESESAPAAAASSSSVKAERPEPTHLDEAHPLLKRALQQPPQPFNVGVTGFQDKVYHKKFRHSGRKDSNEPTSTQESGARSPSPESPASSGHSILASQLAAPPQHSTPGHSLLASTLSRPVSIPGVSRESEQRNEWLANLILDRQRVGQQQQQGQSSQGLLMQCTGQPQPAHSNNIPLAGDRAEHQQQSSTPRHIPVPVAPTQSTSANNKNTHLKMALAGINKSPSVSATITQDSSSTSSTSSSSDTQPLNLSTRTPPPAQANISTEA